MKLRQYISFDKKSKVFSKPSSLMSYRRIVDPVEFDEWYNSYAQISGRIYRGVNDARFMNFTSAQRLYFTHELMNFEMSDLIQGQINYLRSANEHLIEKYCKALGVPCTDVFLLSMAQHHKDSISPLLDFSTDIDTALFFMVDGAGFPVEGIGEHEDGNEIGNYMSLYSAPVNNYISLPGFLNLKNEIYDDLCSKDYDTRELVLKDYSFSSLQKHTTPLYIPSDAEVTIKKQPVRLTASNLNMVAQNGCFIYFWKGINPLEEGLSCVDIHKLLIPYIRKKYLLPKNKTQEYMFPVLDKISSASIEDTLANLKTNY